MDQFRFLTDLAESLWQMQKSIDFWRPAVPFEALPGWLAPSVALAALLSLIVLSGIAVGSLAVLVASLLVAHLLLDQVLGIQLALN